MTPLPPRHGAWRFRDPETDDDDEDDDDEEDEYEYGEEDIEDLPLLETPQNPLGYTLPRVRKNENSDWTSLLLDMKKKHREKGNYFAKRFVKQVRESRGYDVDCLVSGIFMSPFKPKPNFKKDKTYYANVKKAAQYAVDKLNAFRAKSRAHYKLVDVQKVVTNDSGLYVLLTFTVKEVSGENVYKLDKEYYYRDNETNQSTVSDDDDDDDNDNDDEEEDDDGDEDNNNKDDDKDKDKDKGESEDTDGDDDGGEGTIITCQATVDVFWFRKCKGYKLKELRVKQVANAVPAA